MSNDQAKQIPVTDYPLMGVHVAGERLLHQQHVATIPRLARDDDRTISREGMRWR